MVCLQKQRARRCRHRAQVARDLHRSLWRALVSLTLFPLYSGVKFEKEDVILTTGAIVGLFSSLSLLVNNGEEVSRFAQLLA